MAAVASRPITALVGIVLTLVTVSVWWLFAWMPAALVSPLGDTLGEHTVPAPTTAPHAGQALLAPTPLQPTWRLVDSSQLFSAGHVVYLLGAAAILASLAEARLAPRSGFHRLATAGVIVAVAGCLLQIYARSR